MQNIYNMIL